MLLGSIPIVSLSEESEDNFEDASEESENDLEDDPEESENDLGSNSDNYSEGSENNYSENNSQKSFEESSDDDDIIANLKVISIQNKRVSKEIELKNMVNYHLSFVGNPICENYKVCNRFDVECVLQDYGEELYTEFKTLIMDYTRKKLESSSLNKSSSDMDNDLCSMFYETISARVVCSEKNIWYYEESRWKCTTNDHFIWNLLTKEFVKILENSLELYNAYNYINSKSCRDRIISDVKKRLFYDNFESKIDASIEKIGVKNGVLNLLNGTVRKARVSDLISKNTNVDYIPYSMESREVGYLIKLLRKVFPDPNLLKFFIRSCASFLEGRNSRKVFYVWWGTGNNCKTGMATLVASALGDYCGTAPVSLITSKRNSSSEATPELCHIEGKLAIFLQEPNPKEKIKTGRIKELTGNDKIFVRNLYQTGREIDVKCKIIHVCNFPTASPDTDIAFKRRMKVIKFPSTFLDNDEYNQRKKKGILGPNTFRIQEGIEDAFRSLGFAFLSLMVSEYRVFIERGLEVPKIVEQNTEEFLVHGNHILKFIRANLKHSKNGGESDTDSLYRMFKVWLKEHYPMSVTPDSELFIKELFDEGFVDENGDGIIQNIIIPDDLIRISI